MDPTYNGTVSLWASVDHPDDRRRTDNYITVNVPVIARVDLTVGIEGGDGATIGAPSTFAVMVSNGGTEPSNGTVVVHLSPYWEFTIDEASGDGWLCSFGTCSTDATVAAGGTLPPIAVTGAPNGTEDGTISLSAFVSGGSNGRLGNDSSSLTVPVAVTSDLVLAMVADSEVFLVGERNAYTLEVTHAGTTVIDEPVSVTVHLGSWFTGVTGSGEGWTCTSPYDPYVTCQHPGPIPADAALSAISVDGLLEEAFFDVRGSASVSGGTADQRHDNSRVELNTPTAGTSDVSVAVSATATSVGSALVETVTVNNALDTEAIGPIRVTVGVGAFVDAAADGEGWVCAPVTVELRCTHPGPVPGSEALPPITVSGTAAPTYAGVAYVYASVDAPTDANYANDSDYRDVDVAAPIDLAIAIDDGGTPFVSHQTGRLSVDVSNHGIETSSGAVVVAGTVRGVESISPIGDGWVCTIDVPDVECTHPGPVAAGDGLPTIAFDVVSIPGWSTVISSLTVSGGGDGRTIDNSASLFTAVTVVVDLDVAVSDGDASFDAGGTGTYDVAVGNVGSASSSGNITVTLDVDGPVVIDDATGDGWTCASGVGTEWVCNTDAVVDPDASLPTITVTVAVTTTPGVTATLYAAVAGGGDDGGSGNFAAESTPILSPDLTMTVSDGDATFTAPGSGTYSIAVRNAGGASTVGDVVVTPTVSGPATLVALSGDGWTCDTESCSRSDSLPIGGTYPAITAEVAVTVTSVRTVFLSATVTGFDANAFNSTDSDDTPVVVPADLAISAQAPLWIVGRPGVATIVVASVGSADATGPVSVLVGVAESGSGEGWTCEPVQSSISCEHAGPVAPGSALPELSVTYTPTLDDLSGVGVRAELSDPSDGTPGNDVATTQVDVALAVDLTVTASATEPLFTVGQPGQVSFTVSNLGVEVTPGPIDLVVFQNGNGAPALAGDGWSCITLFGGTSCTHPGPLAPGASLPPVVDDFAVMIGDYPATHLNASADHPDDQRPANDGAVLAVPTLGVDLELDLVDRAGDAAGEIGDTRTFDITVANVGGLAPPGSATVTIDPGPGMLLGSTSGVGWACQPDAGVFRCSTTASVPASGDLPVLVFETFLGGDAFPSTILEASVAVPGESRINGLNAGANSFVVNGAPDLVVAVDAPEQAAVGEPLSASITVSNTGQLAANGVTTVDLDVPAGSSTVTGVGTDWLCGPADDGALLRCSTVAVLPAGDAFPTIDVALDVTAGSYPTLRLGAVVDNANDGDIRNNTAVRYLAVIGIPVFSGVASAGSFVAGRPSDLTVSIRNTGTEPGDGATIVTIDPEDADAGLVLTNANGTGWSCTMATVSACEHAGPIPAGGSLDDLVLTYLPDDARFDDGTTCRAVDFGDRLVRGCRRHGVEQPVGAQITFSNSSDVLVSEHVVGAAVRVGQPLDLRPSTGVTNLYAGNLATFTTSVTNAGVDAVTGSITLTQRIGCGLLADLSAGEQGACLPGTDVIDVTLEEVRPNGWSCSVDGEVVTCTHPGPLAAGATLPAVEIDAWIGADLLGANVWVSPSVDAAGDTNTNNDQPERGALIRLRPDPDLAVHVSAHDYTVGVNDLISAQVRNVSLDMLAGPTTLTFELGPELTSLGPVGTGWVCSGASSVSCTHAGTSTSTSTAAPAPI